MKQRESESGGKDQSKRANAAQLTWHVKEQENTHARTHTHTHTQSSSDERGGLTDGPVETHY